MRLSDILVGTSGIALATSLTGHWFLVVPVVEDDPTHNFGWDSFTTVPLVGTAGSSWIDNTALSFKVWAFFVFNLTQEQAGLDQWPAWYSGAHWDQFKWGGLPDPSLRLPATPIGSYGELGPYAGRAFLALLFAGLLARAFNYDYDVPLPLFD